MFADTRASLRHTATPIEKPINPAAYGGAASKRKGQPTINVGADKMAAFLTEMKTHRLRKVGSRDGSFVVPALPSRPAERAREVGDIGNKSEVLSRPRADDVGNRSEALLRPNRSFGVPLPRQKIVPDDDRAVLTQAQAGIKRKRAEDLAGEPQSSLRKCITLFVIQSLNIFCFQHLRDECLPLPPTRLLVLPLHLHLAILHFRFQQISSASPTHRSRSHNYTLLLHLIAV